MGVVPVGPRGHALNSSYRERGEDGYKEDLGYTVANFAKVRGTVVHGTSAILCTMFSMSCF